MSTTADTAVTTQVYRVYIKATPEAIWDAITKPEWTQKYGYRGIAEYDLRPGGRYRALAPEEMQSMGMPEVVVDGEVIEPTRRGSSSRPGVPSGTRRSRPRGRHASPSTSKRTTAGSRG